MGRGTLTHPGRAVLRRQDEAGLGVIRLRGRIGSGRQRAGEERGFLDLPNNLAMHAAPDRRREDEARLVRQVGEWMGLHFYCEIGEKILDAGTPAIVRVQIPASTPDAAGLLYRPWELGYVGASRWPCRTCRSFLKRVTRTR
jgi:hypothetical protein